METEIICLECRAKVVLSHYEADNLTSGRWNGRRDVSYVVRELIPRRIIGPPRYFGDPLAAKNRQNG
jgi:hypothetical protein